MNLTFTPPRAPWIAPNAHGVLRGHPGTPNQAYPVMQQGMAPLTLITLRLFVFSGVTTGFFVLWKIFTRQQYSPIPKLSVSALLPTAGLTGMTFFNYLALPHIAPSLHLTILRLNVIVLAVVGIISLGQNRRQSILYALSFLTIIFAAFFMLRNVISLTGVSLSFMALLSYTLYSLSTERILHHHRISVRYPYLYFYVGIYKGIIGLLLLLFFHDWHLFISPLTLPAIIYIFFCVGLPPIFHTALLQTMQFKHFTDLLLLEVPLGIFFEMILLGIRLPLFVYLLIAFIIAGLLLLRKRELLMQTNG